VRKALTFSLAIVFILTSWTTMRAAEEEKTAKEKLREAEAKAEEQLDEEDSRRNPLMRGKVVLFATPHPDDKAIIGLFISGGKRYKLEVANKELEDKIRKNSKKEVALSGKIRDQGTTFIADNIEFGGPPPGLVRNPDGI